MNHDTDTSSGHTGRSVIDGVFRLLNALADAPGPMGLSDLARRAGLPKATSYRLLNQLVAFQAVERVADRYAIGPQTARLGWTWQPYPGLRMAAEPVVRRVAAVTRSVAGLTHAHPGGNEQLVVPVAGTLDEVPWPRPGGVVLPPDTATSLLLRAIGPATEIPAHLSPSVWRRMRRSARDTGTMLVEHEGPVGVRCTAAPVLAPDGRSVAALFTIVPARRDAEKGLTETVRLAARQITDVLCRGRTR